MTYSVGEMINMIADTYDLPHDVESSLHFRYDSYLRGRKQKVTLNRNETIAGKRLVSENGEERDLELTDIEISSFYPRGSLVEREVTCNSEFMLRNLPDIGYEIRQKMPWIPEDEIIYLVMDNAGGHGTAEAIDQYTTELLEDYHIEIIHQAARSPETNALDLGVWMSVQSHVERAHLHRARNPDTLAMTVQESWRDLPVDPLIRIFDRIPINLQLIVDDGGGNNMSESNRGRR